MSSAECDKEIYERGETAGWIDACSFVAEQWVKRVAAESEQRVDWHYVGGRAVIRFIGDRAKVIAAIGKLEPELKKPVKRDPSDGCGSCSRYGEAQPENHRPARIMHIHGQKKEQ